MKRIQLFSILLLAAIGVQAQQLTASSFYDMHGVLHNPATAGANKYASIGGSFRSQWGGMPGGPQTGLIFGNTYIPKSKLGLGAYIFNDKTGPLTYNGVVASAAYHVALKNDASFSAGLEARVEQFSADKAKLEASLGSNDPVMVGVGNRIRFNAGAGVAYTSKTFQIGASVSQINQAKLELYEGSGNPTIEARYYRHYYLHSNYKWQVDNVTKIIPNALWVYLPNAPDLIQTGVRVEHNNLFWYGLTWRVEQAWMISAGIRIHERFNIGYSFDMYNSPLNSNFEKGANGHEILLRYDFIK